MQNFYNDNLDNSLKTDFYVETTASHTDGITTLGVYFLDKEQQDGIRFTEKLLNECYTNQDVYSVDFVKDYLLQNIDEILKEAYESCHKTLEESEGIFHKGCIEGTPEFLKRKEYLLAMESCLVEKIYEPMPWDLENNTTQSTQDWFDDIGGYLFKNVNTGQVVFGSTYRSCGEMTGANPRLLQLVYTGKRGHTLGWIKGDWNSDDITQHLVKSHVETYIK